MNPSTGTARESIASDQVQTLRDAGVLIEDHRRDRPRYFDGRFLAARDLIRDQQYFLTREADLGQAAGSGVATGLFVQEGGQPQTLVVSSGHGVTPSGELVLLPRNIDVQLANLPVAEQLSARFGLTRLPQPPLRSRTGLFVLALRPVEFTANPIGAYPTSITGQRTVEDGDVIEATAVVLVPWQDDGGADALNARRGRAARAIFTQGSSAGVSANVLPLAMIALQNNTVVWIDEAMVRRELGADRGDLPGLGFAPRGLRLAHLMQHQAHLADVAPPGSTRGFPAITHFPALPPAGPLPAGVINPADFTQNYFPAEIDVDFTIIPEDELPALIEEALALQPIDLTAPAESLDSTAVMIVAPVPRAQWRAVAARVGQGATLAQRVVKPAAPNLIAQRRPFEILQKLRLPREVLQINTDRTLEAEWQRLARLNNLWFVRRRHLSWRDDLAGSYREITGNDERVIELDLNTRIAKLGLTPRYESVLKVATPAAASTVIGLLAGKRYLESPVLTAAALGLLTEAIDTAERLSGKPTLDKTQVLGVAAVLGEPEKNEALWALIQRESKEPIPAAELLSIASGAAWNTPPVDEVAQEERVAKRMDSLGLGDVWTEVFKNSSARAMAVEVQLLSSKRFDASSVLSAAALGLLLEHVQRNGSIKDPALVIEVANSLQEPIASDVLNKYLDTEIRRPMDADTLRFLVKSVDEWRPKTGGFTRPTRGVAPEQAAARKTSAKSAATTKVSAKVTATKATAKKVAEKKTKPSTQKT